MTMKKGEFLGMAILAHALSSSESQIKDSDHAENLNENDELKVIALNLAVFALALDNQLFAKYGVAERSQLMDSAGIKVTEMSKEAFGEENARTVEESFTEYFEELSPFAGRIYAERDNNPKGTLAWEYSTILLKRVKLGRKSCIQAYSSLGNSVKELLESVNL